VQQQRKLLALESVMQNLKQKLPPKGELQIRESELLQQRKGELRDELHQKEKVELRDELHQKEKVELNVEQLLRKVELNVEQLRDELHQKEKVELNVVQSVDDRKFTHIPFFQFYLSVNSHSS
jgi:hypothetical protein